MKKLILPVFAFAMFATTAFATVNTNIEKETPTATTADKKEQISADALPAPVKATLANDEYKEWQVTTAWRITGASEYYVVEFKKGEEATTKKFDKDGKLMS
ncbi:MAG: hypothetical protein EOP51_10990 [Sphingobacteriales bacterium]|nr:MAG: hypothetical protein EOP51_10990 [Sphingobacteriales bacterium]